MAHRYRPDESVNSAAVAERWIVGMGGGGGTDELTRKLLGAALSLSGKERPDVCFVPTASADDPAAFVRFHDLTRGLADPWNAPFHPWPPEGLRERVLAADVIFAAGGNTANMLAIWRVHGFDRLLREAWEAGAVLCGWSAGMICWFEAGVTDSFGPQLEGMRDGLAFLPGSACPHYDGEERRRPVYRKLVADGFPAGVAADDGVGVVYRGTELHEVVAVRPGATAYRVGPDGEESLTARLL
jgi:dipeptidase E